MRNDVLGTLIGLALGALGALGYEHYLGEGKDLADLQDKLRASTASLTQVKHQDVQARDETDAMSAQIQQLTATKDDLTKQVEDLKKAQPTQPSFRDNMRGMVRAGMAQRSAQRLLLLKTRLHLTPEQEAAVKAAMDDEAKRAEDMMAKMQAGGKMDFQAMNDLRNMKSVDQALDAMLTPEQKTQYQQMQTDEKTSAAETQASIQIGQMQPLLQLNDTQKDQVYAALYQVQMNSQDPDWIKANTGTTTTGTPMSAYDVQNQARQAALAKILTPDQLATYNAQAQSQRGGRRNFGGGGFGQ
jgi:Spy/CpxP family protein refolding chaperone